MLKRSSWAIIGILLVGFVQAQEKSGEEEQGPWSGKASLGFLATTGNTENSSLNAGLEVGYATGKWAHIFKALAINSTRDNETSAEAYQVDWKSEYNFSEHNFMFGRAAWRKDRFSGYDTQISETIGYGRRILAAGAHTLNAEIGLGARQSELQDGSREDDLIYRGGLEYKWRFSETAEFTQDFVVEAGEVNVYFESVSALRAQLVGELSLVASYAIKNNSDVPAGTANKDTYSALSLEYGF